MTLNELFENFVTKVTQEALMTDVEIRSLNQFSNRPLWSACRETFYDLEDGNIFLLGKHQSFEESNHQDLLNQRINKIRQRASHDYYELYQIFLGNKEINGWKEYSKRESDHVCFGNFTYPGKPKTYKETGPAKNMTELRNNVGHLLWDDKVTSRQLDQHASAFITLAYDITKKFAKTTHSVFDPQLAIGKKMTPENYKELMDVFSELAKRQQLDTPTS